MYKSIKYALAVYTIFLSLCSSCSSKEKTDEELLALDKKELVKSLDSYKVFPYKFGKILIRSSIEKDTISTEFRSFKKDIDRLSSKLLSHNIKEQKKLSLLDYISIYRDYKKMESFVMKTDEDMFPTVIDALNIAYGDSIRKKRPYYKGKQKEMIQNLEHFVLSAIVILSKDVGKEISLYECSKTNPDLLPDSEIKTLLQYFRGFLFFEKGLYYLSEDEISRNITWLNNNKGISLPYTRALFQWGNFNDEQTHTGIHALNHLFRAFDRLMMNREVDEKRSLEDFEIFLKDANVIGLNNEITWAIETYLYIKNEKKENAIASLQKLKKSELLSSKEKLKIEESITYLKERESGSILNKVYDKYFLSKIATKYMFSVLAKVEWKKIMKENEVPYVDEMFVVIDNVRYMLSQLQLYMSAEGIKEAGKNIKDEGSKLFDKAKDLLK